MKKLNSKGFTLIELLAVITILGILMLVAIPAISRTIENSRKDTFMDTGKLYADAVRTAVSAEEVKCGTDYLSAASGDKFYVWFCSKQNAGETCNTDLMQSGGKSSWKSRDVHGYVQIVKDTSGSTIKYTYKVTMTDGAHGFALNDIDDLGRADVTELASVTQPDGTACVVE